MVKFVNEADNAATVPFTKEQLEWILTHMRLTRKGKKLAKQIRRWIWQK